MNPTAHETAETGVVWFRRDLRLDNNPAWLLATERCRRVVALFVLDQRLLEKVSSIRQDLLYGHLEALNRQLVEIGGRLVVRKGDPALVIPEVVAEAGAALLYHNADYGPFAKRRDRLVAERTDASVVVSHGSLVHRPGSVLTKKGTVSRVFSPFYRRWAVLEPDLWPSGGAGEAVGLPSSEIPAPSATPVMRPGDDGATDRLSRWLEKVDSYGDSRDLPAVDGTSGLSADLKFGTIAARTVVAAVGESTPGRASFVRQLAWRDWYAHTMNVEPRMHQRALREEFDRINWVNDADDFARWTEGRTGFPIVDAGMRQLVATGRLHNRVRMIAASFLVKDLLVDWRKGEAFFRHHLIDADPSQNVGNWQWVAGTGPDASPYFRVFNPTVQSRKFDRDGEYIRRWVPELRSLMGDSAHDPASAAPLDLLEAGVILGVHYPEPIVDHQQARRTAIEAYGLASRGQL